MHKQIFQALSLNLVLTAINDVILGNNLRAWNLIQPGTISIKCSLLRVTRQATVTDILEQHVLQRVG